MDRPRIITCSIASIDGRITLAPGCLLLDGDPRWQSVAGSSDETYQAIKQNFNPQAMLEGSGSFILESQIPEELPPQSGDPAQLYQDFLPDSIVNQPDRRWFTVVDGRGRIRWLYKEFPGEEWKGWYLLVLVSFSTPLEYLAYLRRENIPYLVAGEHKVDLSAAFEKMGQKLKVERMVSTAGGRLSGALLRSGLVDEINVIFFPAVIGGLGTPALFDAPPLDPKEAPIRLKLLSSRVVAREQVWLHYEIIRD